jgi:hypothetical protein
VACPAIWREAAVNSVHSMCVKRPSRLVLLPLRGRSRDKPRSYCLRSESKAALPTQVRFCRRLSDAVRTSASVEGVGARLPAIWREAAADTANAACTTRPSRLVLLPLRGRSRDKPRSYCLRPESKAVLPTQVRFCRKLSDIRLKLRFCRRPSDVLRTPASAEGYLTPYAHPLLPKAV